MPKTTKVGSPLPDAEYEVKVLHTEARYSDGSEDVAESTVIFHTAAWNEQVKAYGSSFRKMYERRVPELYGNDPRGVDLLCRDIYLAGLDSGDSAPLLFFCLYCWQLFKAGRIKREAWGMVLSRTWQEGPRTSLFQMAVIPESQVREMFAAASPASLMRTPAMLKKFRDLPERVEIWRGASSGMTHHANGYSWTGDRRWAEWFASRNAKERRANPLLLHGWAKREDVWATFDKEDEVVVAPGAAHDIDVVELPIENLDARLHELWEQLTGQKPWERDGRH